MNKLLIVLLVAAIGAGTFYFLQKKKTVTSSNDIEKELIIGQWKIDSMKTNDDPATSFMVGIMALVDSNALNYQYQFTKEGTILRSLKDSIFADTSRYEWKEKQLVWKEDVTDSVGTTFSVLTLNKDSLLVRDMDSTQVLFLKIK